MNFSVTDHDIDERTHLIELSGEVDLYSAPEFKELVTRAIDQGKRRLVVDMTGATFIDSTTLGVLMSGAKRLNPEGGAVELVCSDERILKTFRITGLDRVFRIHDTREEALANSGSARGVA
jgi:anti-sigma B factor antagonist